MDTRFNEIQETVLQARNEASELNALEVLTPNEQSILSASSTSKVAQWRLWIYIFSFAIWLLEKTTIENSKNTKEQNYQNFKAEILNYHDGLELVWINGGWGYDLTGVLNPEERKIIKNTAIIEPNEGGLIVKITGEDGPIASEPLERFKTYVAKKKVPGIPISIINNVADLIMQTITVYCNPEIIDLTTGRLLNVSEEVYPVKEAIQNYLLKLEFNGAFVKDFYKNEILKAPGVYLVEIDEMKWKYGGFPFVDFGALKVPESGHFKILEENLTINYLTDALVYN